jgi:hypothetical protein
MKLRIIPKILLAFSLPFFLFACSEKKTLTRLDLPDNLTYFRYIFDTPIAYSKKMSIDQNFVCDGEVFNFDVTYSYNVQTLLIAVEIIDKANLEMATMYGPLLLRNAVDEQLIAKTTYVGIEGEYSVTFDDRGDHSATTNIDFNSYATSTSTQAQQSFPNIFSYVDTNIDLDNFAYLQGYT